jgi:hypothetical protein
MDILIYADDMLLLSDDNYSLCRHWDIKTSNIAGKIALLQQAGLHNQYLSTKTKAFLFKVYLRLYPSSI